MGTSNGSQVGQKLRETWGLIRDWPWKWGAGGSVVGLSPSTVGPGLTPVRAGMELEDTHTVSQGISWSGENVPHSWHPRCPVWGSSVRRKEKPTGGVCLPNGPPHTAAPPPAPAGRPRRNVHFLPRHMESGVIFPGIGAGGIMPDQPGRCVSRSLDTPILFARVCSRPGEVSC